MLKKYFKILILFLGLILASLTINSNIFADSWAYCQYGCSGGCACLGDCYCTAFNDCSCYCSYPADHVTIVGNCYLNND